LAAGLLAPGNTLALMSGSLKTLSTKFAGVSNSTQKPAGVPQQPAGGGGSYTGPGSGAEGAGTSAGHMGAPQHVMAREASAANAIAAVEAVTAQRAGGAPKFDRYGRPLDGEHAGGDVDLSTINQIIANLEGGGGAGAAAARPDSVAHAPAQTVPKAALHAPHPQAGGGLGLEPRAAAIPADDDARCE
jgi:hypothetical protein